jgi:hypothetical protein
MIRQMPKQKTKRDPKYLAWIRKQPCGYQGRFCKGKIEAHHVRRQRWGAGTSQKPHDYVAVPRCQYHHAPDCEMDVELEIIDLLIEYFGK